VFDIGVALTWIAISAASTKGLSVLARAAAMSESDAEAAALVGEGPLAHEELRVIADTPFQGIGSPCLPRARP
jgi:hypothetical protein